MPLHLFYRYEDRECNPNFDDDFDCHPFPNPDYDTTCSHTWIRDSPYLGRIEYREYVRILKRIPDFETEEELHKYVLQMPGAEFWGPLEVSARYPQWLKLQRRQCPLIGRVCELWERLEEVQDTLREKEDGRWPMGNLDLKRRLQLRF